MINVLLKGSDPTEPREGLRTQGESRAMLWSSVAPTGGGRAGAPFSHNLPVCVCVFKDCDAESFLSGSDEEDCPGRELPRARANGTGVPPAALETGDGKRGIRKAKGTRV